MKQVFLFIVGEAARYLKGGTMVKRAFVLAAACATALLVAFPSAAAEPGNVTCVGTFTGTAKDLTVPANGDCTLDGATITHDVIVGANAEFAAVDGTTIGHDLNGSAFLDGVTIGHDVIAPPDGGVGAINTTIGHDLIASNPNGVSTGQFGCGPPDCPAGPVRVGHDLVLSGSDAPNGVTYSICDTTVGHDLRTNDLVSGPRSVTSGAIEIGAGFDCSFALSPPNAVGHDLIVTGNQMGFPGDPVGSFIEVGSNSVGHDLTVSGNSAPAAGGFIDVSNNSVRHDATCSANTPPASPLGGPNLVRHNNSCG